MFSRSRSVPALAGLLALLAGGLLASSHLKAQAPAGSSAQPALPPVAGSGTFSIPLSSGTQLPAQTPAAAESAATTTSGTTDLGAAGDAYKPWVGKKFSHGPGGAKIIALTFDDGPHPKNTALVVKALKDAGATATFFWIGEMVQKNPSVAKLVQASGFEFGNHSWDHPLRFGQQSDEQTHDEIVKTQDEIQKVTGVRPHLFRPPGGAVNAKVTKNAKDNNLAMVLWVVDPNDWNIMMSPAKILATIEKGAHPGAIVLMHDIRPNTAQILPQYLAFLKAQGYQFVTVSQLMAEANKHPEAMSGAGADTDEAGGDAATPLTIPLTQTK